MRHWRIASERAAREGGFTLVEMTTSVGVLFVVLSAAWLLLNTSGDNLNRIQFGGQASELNRAALASFGRDVVRGVVNPDGSSPIILAEPTACAMLADIDADGRIERVEWAAEGDMLLRGITEAPSTIPVPTTEDDFADGTTATSTVLTGLVADPPGEPLFSYYAGASMPTSFAGDVGLVKMHLRNGLPTPTDNAIDRTAAYRVVAFVINGY